MRTYSYPSPIDTSIKTENTVQRLSLVHWPLTRLNSDIKDSTVLNGGMENEFNTVKVTYNTGVSNVIGIDILYKKSDSNAIYVARKIDKKTPVFVPDNIEQTLIFDNSDIYTILNESEILRLYDNVPRLAKAQDIMGRRLMYGNYLEG